MSQEAEQLIDRAIVERVILAAAPERADEVRAIWEKFDPLFVLLPDRAGITLQARGRRIEFDDKTMAAFWLLGFAAWKIFVCHSPHLVLSLASGRPINATIFGKDDGLAAAEEAFESLLYTLRGILQASSLDDVSWPSDVPRPQADKTGLTIDQQATFDLLMIAAAYAFLHEIRHLIFAKDPDRPSAPDEEIACDTYARDFLLDKIDEYAARSQQCPDKVLMKRAMGAALGAFMVQEVTAREVKAGTSEYPPFADRLDVLIGQVQNKANDDFWIFAGALLLATLRRLDRAVDIPPEPLDVMCRRLIDEIRKRN